VFELHGNMQWVKCLSCGRRYSMEEIQERLKQGEEHPDCLDCHGILKPEGVFFGEALPQRELIEATNRSRSCDLFIVIGSTLVVYPAAYMPYYARDAGAKLVIINLTSTPIDQDATVLIRSKAGEAMTRIMERVRSKM
jgi:NAD-dependent deacetylase